MTIVVFRCRFHHGWEASFACAGVFLVFGAATSSPVYGSSSYNVVSDVGEVSLNRASKQKMQDFLGQCFRSAFLSDAEHLASCPVWACFGVLSWVLLFPLLVGWRQAALVYGQMNEPPGARARVLRRDGLGGLRIWVSWDTCCTWSRDSGSIKLWRVSV